METTLAAPVDLSGVRTSLRRLLLVGGPALAVLLSALVAEPLTFGLFAVFFLLLGAAIALLLGGRWEIVASAAVVASVVATHWPLQLRVAASLPALQGMAAATDDIGPAGAFTVQRRWMHQHQDWLIIDQRPTGAVALVPPGRAHDCDIAWSTWPLVGGWTLVHED